jgi:hypothetical protein
MTGDMPRARIEIDLNMRVKERGNDTFVGFEDLSRPVILGEIVEVYESESGVAGEGRVTEIDEGRRLVYLSVDWPSLKEEAACAGPDGMRLSDPAKGGYAVARELE